MVKLKLKIILHYAVGNDEFDGDYSAVSVYLGSKKLKTYGDYYHDKGEERAESFCEGYALAKGLDFDETIRTAKADWKF